MARVRPWPGHTSNSACEMALERKAKIGSEGRPRRFANFYTRSQAEPGTALRCGSARWNRRLQGSRGGASGAVRSQAEPGIEKT